MDQIQGHAALLVSTISIVFVLSLLFAGLRHEKKRPQDESDDH